MMEAALKVVEPRLSLRRLAQDYLAATKSDPSLRDVAEHLYEAHGDFLFVGLDHDEKITLIANRLRIFVNTERRSQGFETTRIYGGDSREAHLRLAAGGKGFWSSRWNVGGHLKETRALTRADVEYLIRERHSQREELRVQVLWLLAVLKLARAHNVKKTLGELEAKGIPLPVIEVEEEKSWSA